MKMELEKYKEQVKKYLLEDMNYQNQDIDYFLEEYNESLLMYIKNNYELSEIAQLIHNDICTKMYLAIELKPITYIGDEFNESYKVADKTYYHDVKLYKEKLYYTVATDFSRIVGECRLKGFIREDYYWDDVVIPYEYTGKLFVVNDDSLVSGYHDINKGFPWWSYKDAIEITFEKGIVIKQASLSEKMNEIFNLITNNKNFDENFKNDFDMIDFLKNNIDYKDIWWLNNILNNINVKYSIY